MVMLPKGNFENSDSIEFQGNPAIGGRWKLKAIDDVIAALVGNSLSVPASLKAAVLGGLLQTEANGIVSELREVAVASRIEPSELRALLDVYARVYVEEVLNGRIVSGAAITRHTREARQKRTERGQGRFFRTFFGHGESHTSLIEEGEQLAAEIEVARGELNSLQIEIARLRTQQAASAQTAAQAAVETCQRAEQFAIKTMEDAQNMIERAQKEVAELQESKELLDTEIRHLRETKNQERPPRTADLDIDWNRVQSASIGLSSQHGIKEFRKKYASSPTFEVLRLDKDGESSEYTMLYYP